MKELIVKLYDLSTNQLQMVDEYVEKLLHPKKHRSLSQNSYAWKLITEIGDKVNEDKEKVYLDMLVHYGQSELVSVKADINISGYFKYYKEAGKSVLNGVEFKHYKIYKGSSEFDTREMAIFINGIIQEAENLGIPTLTPDQVRELKLV